jgi:pimeloyl-ACP methyl ester carboxylesterase
MSRQTLPALASAHHPQPLHDLHGLPPPSPWLLAMELRAPWEFGASMAAWPLLQRAPRGDGHGVIVYPGLSANDASTIPLRRFLRHLGYEVHGWEQGFNFGPRHGVLEMCKAHLRHTEAIVGGKVSLVGWSLGGIYARELAKAMPELVRNVVTLGSPFAGPPSSTHAGRLYEAVSGRDIQREREHYDLPLAPPVPFTSIYSRSDGIVAWQGSIQRPSASNPRTENVEVVASHIGLGMNPAAWWVLADRLAQPEGEWKPFERQHALKRLVFPDPARPH